MKLITFDSSSEDPNIRAIRGVFGSEPRHGFLLWATAFKLRRVSHCGSPLRNSPCFLPKGLGHEM
jgi:hypothetical protein